MGGTKLPIPTKELLAQRIHSLGLLDLERRARLGEFSDFESDHATPKKLLVDTLFVMLNAGTLKNPTEARVFANEVMNGDWDDTKEEADAWFEREGKHLLDK